MEHARGSRGSRGSGDAARSSEPGKHAHTFRMTLVVQGNKLPQINATFEAASSVQFSISLSGAFGRFLLVPPGSVWFRRVRLNLREFVALHYERHPESMRTVPWLRPAGRDSVSAASADVRRRVPICRP